MVFGTRAAKKKKKSVKTRAAYKHCAWVQLLKPATRTCNLIGHCCRQAVLRVHDVCLSRASFLTALRNRMSSTLFDALIAYAYNDPQQQRECALKGGAMHDKAT
jgi:hypothetical protein